VHRARIIARNGIEVRESGGAIRRFEGLAAVDEDSTEGPFEVVILATKAHQIGGTLRLLSRVLTSKTIVVSTQNGIPWWYFQESGGPFESYTIEASDPGGRIGNVIDPKNIVGCVVYPAITMLENGQILISDGSRFPVGAVARQSTNKAHVIADLFVAAGFKSPLLDDLRGEIWLKAVGNGSLNPISALTRATLVEICRHPDASELVRKMMIEAEAVAASLGITLRVSVDRRLEGAQRIGAHRSSMLQDVNNNVPLEVEALIGAIAELGRLTRVSTPSIDVVLALTRLLNQTISDDHR
jgi:2-dehydropantoate 2-reductase